MCTRVVPHSRFLLFSTRLHCAVENVSTIACRRHRHRCTRIGYDCANYRNYRFRGAYELGLLACNQSYGFVWSFGIQTSRSIGNLINCDLIVMSGRGFNDARRNNNNNNNINNKKKHGRTDTFIIIDQVKNDKPIDKSYGQFIGRIASFSASMANVSLIYGKLYMRCSSCFFFHVEKLVQVSKRSICSDLYL